MTKILVDCPPTLVASDAVLVGRIVDGMVLIVRPDKNRRKLVFRATQNLTEMKIPLFGLVANGVGAENNKGYSFGEGEGYGYGYGYGDDENNDEDEGEIEQQGNRDSYQGISFQSKTFDQSENDQEKLPAKFRKTA